MFVDYPEPRAAFTQFFLRKKEILFPPTRVHGVMIQIIKKETEAMLYSQQLLLEPLQSYLINLFSLLVGSKMPNYEEDTLYGFDDISSSKLFPGLAEDLFMLADKADHLRDLLLYVILRCYRQDQFATRLTRAEIFQDVLRIVTKQIRL